MTAAFLTRLRAWVAKVFPLSLGRGACLSRADHELATRSNNAATRPWGYNVIGYISGALGLGVAGRNSVRTLLQRGERVWVLDIDPGFGRIGTDPTFEHLHAKPPGAPFTVNLFHINPEQILQFEREWWKKTSMRRTLNVCVPFWELPKLPSAWLPVLEAMDCVLAPSRFIYDACRAALPGGAVLLYSQCVYVPDDIVPDRCRWALPEDAVVFLSALDLFSDITRKNPWAVVECFRSAFPSRADVHLVVKVSGQPTERATQNEYMRLCASAAQDPRISVIAEHLPYRDVLTLYASCDVLVSLHRSEGLGLHLMEAMALGKTVVATGWSGNTDFMTETNSCLVGYKLVPVISADVNYRAELIGTNQVWADPDLGDAVSLMRRLGEDFSLRQSLGRQAKSDMSSLKADASHGAVFDVLQSQADDDAKNLLPHKRRSRQLRKLVVGGRWQTRVDRTKRTIVHTLRRAHLYPPDPSPRSD